MMQMQPDFDKAHEIYFRLGIIYKQQQKFNQSLEVRPAESARLLECADCHAVLQIHRQFTAGTPYRGRHLVPDRTRARTTERRMLDLDPYPAAAR